MATKRTASNTSPKVSAEQAAKAAASAPAAKSRVTSAKHSKPAASEPISEVTAAPAPVSKAAITTQNSQEAIAKIAYGYWLARGCQGGDQAEDWFRAEAEYRSL